MTNKEKYPNAKIIQNPSAPQECGGTWYIRLVSEFGKRDQYLLKNLQVGPHDHDNPSNTYFPSEAAAKTALDNFMNETPEITLKEIKLQLEEAKKLIGKNVRFSLGMGTYREKCEKVFFALEEASNTSLLMEKEIKTKGYCIGVKTSGQHTLPLSMCEEIKTISVVAHDGQTYTAESDGNCWKFGCARISKSLIREAYNLFLQSSTGNRQVEKITIGKCDFSRETLKALVELENNV